MSEEERQHPKDPLHGVTLETIIRTLQERHGWEEMGWRVRVRCFNENPSIKSSLTFLRKTPWAREKIEAWYVRELKRYGKAGGSPPPPAAPES
jgi:uncharacterized protein (DUF2132 family)